MTSVLTASSTSSVWSDLSTLSWADVEPENPPASISSTFVYKSSVYGCRRYSAATPLHSTYTSRYSSTSKRESLQSSTTTTTTTSSTSSESSSIRLSSSSTSSSNFQYVPTTRRRIPNRQEQARREQRRQEKIDKRFENERNRERNRLKKLEKEKRREDYQKQREMKKQLKEQRRIQWKKNQEAEKERRRAEFEAREQAEQARLDSMSEQERHELLLRRRAARLEAQSREKRKLFIGLKWQDIEQMPAKQKEATRRARIAALRKFCEQYGGPVQDVRVLLRQSCMFVVFQSSNARQRCLAMLTYEQRLAVATQPCFSCLDPHSYYGKLPKPLKPSHAHRPLWIASSK